MEGSGPPQMTATARLLPLRNRAGTPRFDPPLATDHRQVNSQPLADGRAHAAPVRRTRRRGYRVHLLTVVLTAIAGLLIGLVVTPLHGLAAPRGIPWWMLVPLFGAAEIFVVH